MKKLYLSIIALLSQFSLMGNTVEKIDLSGIWRFQSDIMNYGKTPGSELYLNKLTETIYLPGSTDQAGKGVQNFAAHVDRLSRKYEYCGQAWYQREVNIPEDWADKIIQLSLERCHWETTVYIDGVQVGVDERISTPNRFILTKHLAPGVHTLTLCIDNRIKYPMDNWNHGTTEYTQTNWNGAVGDLSLEAFPQSYISDLRVDTDIQKRTVKSKLNIFSKEKKDGVLKITVTDKNGKNVSSATYNVSLSEGENKLSYELPAVPKIELWNEFNPYLYNISAQLDVDSLVSDKTETFGFRKVEQGKHHIRLNGKDIHLRGVLDCAVFPLTGYPATDKDSWLKIFRTVKNYGMNHVRFHSWCPPEAAFCAADEVGMYIQAELPMWIKDVGQYPSRRDFFEKEMYSILKEYGNHPSFILMCNGNENEGDFSVLEDLILKAQKEDNRRLYSASTARTHVKADEFYVSHVSEKGWITVYEGKPSTDWDVNSTSDIDVPVIAHETGQRCMYPNFNEIGKYKGVLEPRNFNIFRERLAKNGMLHQAEDFFRATGAHTVLQYKEVNEALLRSDKSGGFQLLGLSDFPGQGSAFVGILDAFWEDKGLVTPEKFRESCAPTVVLARIPKRVFSEKETLPVKLEVYNFGENDINKGNLKWSLTDGSGVVVSSGKLSHGRINTGIVDSLGLVNVSLDKISVAGKYTFHAYVDKYHNEWDIWVYPTVQKDVDSRNFVMTEKWEEAKKYLYEGKKVLFVPKQVKGRKTKFASHFWNPIMFNWNPMIVGTLIDSEHKAFEHFPTSYYADWQWWDILNNCTAVDLTGIGGLTPIIQSVDTYEENRKLGIAFEAKVGDGSLLVLCTDLYKNIDSRPATQQLIYSFKNYVSSDSFVPAAEVPAYLLDSVFDVNIDERKSVNNSSAINQLLNK